MNAEDARKNTQEGKKVNKEQEAAALEQGLKCAASHVQRVDSLIRQAGAKGGDWVIYYPRNTRKCPDSGVSEGLAVIFGQRGFRVSTNIHQTTFWTQRYKSGIHITWEP